MQSNGGYDVRVYDAPVMPAAGAEESLVAQGISDGAEVAEAAPPAELGASSLMTEMPDMATAVHGETVTPVEGEMTAAPTIVASGDTPESDLPEQLMPADTTSWATMTGEAMSAQGTPNVEAPMTPATPETPETPPPASEEAPERSDKSGGD
jgi:hypothetical protein